IRYLILTAWRRLDMFGDVNDGIIIKIQSRHGIIGFRLLRLLFNRNDTMVTVKFHHTIAFGVGNGIGKYHAPTRRQIGTLLQQARQPFSVEDVVAEYQCYLVVPYKIFTDYKSLG